MENTDSYKDKLVFKVDRAQRIVHDFKNKVQKSVNGENIFKSVADLVHKLTQNLRNDYRKTSYIDYAW